MKGISIAFFLLMLFNGKSFAGACSECGLSNIGTISGSSSVCTGQPITFTFDGSCCLYSGCTLQYKIKVFSGSTLVFTSTTSTSTSHSFTTSTPGTYKVYGYVKANGYSPWCESNYLNFTVSSAPTGVSITSVNTALVGDNLTVSGSASGSGNTFQWNFGSGATPATATQGPVQLLNDWTSSTGSYNFTNSAGSNRILILTVGMEHGTEVNLTGVTYGGKSMTQAIEKSIVTNAPSYNRVEIWYLKESDLAMAGAGSKAFSFTWSGTPDNIMYSAAVFSNVDQSTPIGNTQSREGSTNPLSVSSSLSVDVNDMVVLAGVCGNPGTYTPCVSGYEEGVDFIGNSTVTLANYTKSITTAGTETPGMSFSRSVNRQGIAALVLNGIAGGALNIAYSTVGPKTVSLTVVNASGCSTTVTKVIDICGKAIITSPNSNCTNTLTPFTATDMGGNSTYTWNFGAGATPATATGLGPHNVMYSSTGTKTVTLTVGNSTMSSCNNVCTKEVVISQGPTATIDGPTTGVMNSNYTFTTNAVTGATYAWTVPTDGIIISGATTNTIVIKWPTGGSKSFTVVTTKNGCTATDNHGIVIAACPEAVINPVSDICKTSPQTFSAVSQGTGVSYSWNFGSNSTPGTASSIGPHTVNYSVAGSKTVSLTVSKSGCTNHTTTRTFTVNESPIVTITAPTFGIFADTAITYSVPSTSGATYVWSATGDAIITGTGNSRQILFPNSGSQTITVNGTLNGCTSTATKTITVIEPVCESTKFNFKNLPLKTNMKNFTYIDPTNSNYVKLKKSSFANDSFHTSRKFQRSGDTAISWQENCATSAKTTLKFNRPANDVRFSIRDLDKTSNAQEIITITGYAGGSPINTSGISATYGSTTVQVFNNTGTSVSYKGLTTASNSSSTNDIAFSFTTKVDSVALVLSNTSNASGNSGNNTTTSPDGKYRVELIDAGIGGPSVYTWTWKMTNINPSSSSQAISHWDIVFPYCSLCDGILDDITSVQYSYNGTTWTNLTEGAYQNDPSMTCDNEDVFKFDRGMDNASVIYYRLKLNRAYDVDYNATSFWKAGTACGEMTFAGIGCATPNCLSDVGLSKMTFCIIEPLPVSWLSIKAIKNNKGGVDVKWATASEINNDFFTVEKSLDNRNFNQIGTVKGSGTKNTTSHYSFEDYNPGALTVYYRIKQTDFNGEFDYSSVVAITPLKGINNVSFQPNPASNMVSLNWESDVREVMTIQLTTISGLVILSEQLPVDGNAYNLNIDNVNNGLYMVNIMSKGSMVFRSKLVVAK